MLRRVAMLHQRLLQRDLVGRLILVVARPRSSPTRRALRRARRGRRGSGRACLSAGTRRLKQLRGIGRERLEAFTSATLPASCAWRAWRALALRASAASASAASASAASASAAVFSAVSSAAVSSAAAAAAAAAAVAVTKFRPPARPPFFFFFFFFSALFAADLAAAARDVSFENIEHTAWKRLQLRKSAVHRDKGSPAANSDLNSPPRGGGGPEAGNADLRPTHEKASFSVMSLFGRYLVNS
jgi:hypothetical protein